MKAVRAVNAVLDPKRELREANEAFDRTPTAYHRARLAAALLAQGERAAAIRHYGEAARGPYADDASFLAGLADAQLRGGQADASAATLERLFAAHPGQRRDALALRYAEALAAAGRPEARGAFEAALAAEDLTEGRCKFGTYLRQQGDTAGARAAFEAVLANARRGHVHSRDLNSAWIAEATTALKAMG